MPKIHVDAFGYRPDFRKVAVIADPQEGFNAADSYTPGATLQLVNAAGAVVFEAAPTAHNSGATDPDSGDAGWTFDFSSWTEAGTYTVHDPSTGLSSESFSISADVYAPILRTAGRALFYNRCGYVKPEANAGAWSDGLSFQHPGQDTECTFVGTPDDVSTARDLRGGWFDAGDYNKYVTFAESAVSTLLEAYLRNPEAFGDSWNIPDNPNSIPDLIEELEWELNWVYRMTNSDGSCILKMGSTDFALNEASPPSANTDPRHYSVTCTSASWAAAHMLAKACNVPAFEINYPFAEEIWQIRAEHCWIYAHDKLLADDLETNCDQGEILAGDADVEWAEQIESALCAAIYLYALTGSDMYHDFILEYAPTLPHLLDDYWSPYNLAMGDALLHYTTLASGDATLQASILESLSVYQSNNWDNWVGSLGENLYQAFMPNYSYHWGSNLVNANGAAMLLQCLYNPTGEANTYQEKAAAHMHYLHGVNPLGLCYLSNMGEYGAANSCNQIYHAWFADGSAFDDVETGTGPAPGFLVGGANEWFSVAAISPPAGQPRQKSYLDFNDSWPNNSWEVSEPSISYQAAYIRLLSEFVETDIPDNLVEVQAPTWSLFPNPSGDVFWIEGGTTENIEVYAANGQLLQVLPAGTRQVDVTGWKVGVYVVRSLGKAPLRFVKR